jgi:hypothetical protein
MRSLLHHVQEGVLSHLHLPNRLQLLLSLLVPVQELLLSGVVAAVALGSHVLLYVRNLLLRDGLRADPRLDAHCEQVRRNGLLDLNADVLGIVVGLLLVHQEGERIHRLIHDVNDHFHDIRPLELSVLVLERPKPMSDRLYLIHEVDDYFSQRQLVLQNSPALI